jgi:hypothetical protein
MKKLLVLSTLVFGSSMLSAYSDLAVNRAFIQGYCETTARIIYSATVGGNSITDANLNTVYQTCLNLSNAYTKDTPSSGEILNRLRSKGY